MLHLFLIFLLCGLHCVIANYTLAGFFSLFDANNHPNDLQFQSAAGFELAIREINSRSDILPSTYLNFTIRGGNGFQGASINAADTPSSVVAAVGGMGTVETSAIDQVFAVMELVMVHSFASDTDFGNGAKYPYKVQTCPVDSFQGMALQNMMCNFFNFTRVVVFASNDQFGSKAAIESGDGSYCNIDNLETFLFPSYTTDFTTFIQRGMKLEASVFLLFMNAENAAMLLEQGFDQGLFREGTQILGPSNLLSPSLFNFFTPTADVPAIMKGVIAIEYWPSYRIDMLGSSLDFVSGFRSLPSTNVDCSSVVDATGYHYLYPNGDTTLSCHGLNFSSFDRNGTTIDPFAALTYDATYVVAHALDVLLSSGQDVNGNNLLRAIYNNVSFEGASGLIEIYEGMANYGYYARGDREVGHHYRIRNFNADAYAVNPNSSFVQVMVWSVENGVQSCDSWMDCSDVIYNTVDNSMPSAYPPYTFSKPPNYVKIGGLFAPVDQYGRFDVIEAENLAAFLMAIDDINNKTDGVFDFLLPNTKLVYALETGREFAGAVTAAQNLVESFYSTGVYGVVCGLPNLETMAADQLFRDHKIVQAHSMATDTNLGFGDTFPYKIQTCPIDSFQGMVLQNIICSYFAYKKVTIFATSDTFGSKASMEAVDGTYCNIEVLSTHLFRSDTLDFSSVIASAKFAGAQIFLFFMGTQNTANLLEQGYDAGLFHEGTQVFSSNYSMGPDLFHHFSYNANVPAIMKGFIGIDYWPNYTELRSVHGRDFLRRWREQPYTGRAIRHEENRCDVSRDNAASSFLYTSQTNQSLCAGLNFSSYDINGTNLNPYAGLTYDATFLIAYGIHYVIEAGWELNGDNLLKAIFNNVSFEGVTGLIEIYQGMSSFGFYARGDREVGHHYRIMNFNEDAYLTNPNESFVQVMLWSVEDGVQMCDEMTVCSSVIYNTIDNLPAKDTPSDFIVVQNTAERAVLFFFAAAVFVGVGFTGFVIISHRNAKLVKASQPSMLYFILIGQVLAGIRIVIAALPITDGSCIAGLWFGHLAFALVFGTFLVKTWRVHKIVNNKSLRRIKITTTQVNLMVLAGVFFLVLYLIILTVVGNPHKSAHSSTVSNQTTREIRCTLSISVVHTILFAIEAVILLAGARICWAVKDVPDAINESKYIAGSMIVIVLVCSLAFPVVFLISLTPPMQQIIASISFALGSLATSFVFFGPKIDKLRHGQDIRDIGTSVKKEASDSKMENGKMPSVYNEAILMSQVALNPLSHEDKSHLCNDQIGKWRALLMQVSDRASNSASSTSHGSSANNRVSEYKELPLISPIE